VDAVAAGGDRGEDHISCRQGEVVGVVLTDAEEIHAYLLGKYTLFDEVPDRLGMREWAVVSIVGDIAEGVEAEYEREVRGFAWGITHDI